MATTEIPPAADAALEAMRPGDDPWDVITAIMTRANVSSEKQARLRALKRLGVYSSGLLDTLAKRVEQCVESLVPEQCRKADIGFQVGEVLEGQDPWRHCFVVYIHVKGIHA